MLPLVNIIVTLIVLLSIDTIIIVHSDEEVNDWMETNAVDNSNLRFDSGVIPGAFETNLDNLDEGDTVPYSYLSDIITDSRIEDDVCQFRFGPQITDYFGNRLLIGELTQLKTVVSVQIIFYDESDGIVNDDSGNPIQYSSSPHDLGHLLDILHQGFAFSYAKCLLKLQRDSNFNIHNLFFHFSNSSSISSEINQTGIINGVTSFSIDSKQQTYNVSVKCPISATCMWLLDNKVIFGGPDTSVTLTFEQKDIGNRTLSYMAYCKRIRRTLASLLLSILPSTTRKTTTSSTAASHTTGSSRASHPTGSSRASHPTGSSTASHPTGSSTALNTTASTTALNATASTTASNTTALTTASNTTALTTASNTTAFTTASNTTASTTASNTTALTTAFTTASNTTASD